MLFKSEWRTVQQNCSPFSSSEGMKNDDDTITTTTNTKTAVVSEVRVAKQIHILTFNIAIVEENV